MCVVGVRGEGAGGAVDRLSVERNINTYFVGFILPLFHYE